MHDAADPPRAPDLPAALELDTDVELTDGAQISELELTDADMSARWARNVAFVACLLKRPNMSESRFEQLRVTDVRCESGNLANVHAPGTHGKRVELEGCRLTGAHLFAAHLTDVRIRSCRVDLATFGSSRMERVTFEDCLLTQTDFLDAELESVCFQGCDLTGADLRGAKLTRCEFRRSNLSDLQGIGSLRGAALEWGSIVEMAGVWAGALGIEVLDREELS